MALFQHTKLEKGDFFRLIQSMNRIMDDDVRLNDITLKKVYNKWWPEFDLAFKAIIKDEKGKRRRDEWEAINELLDHISINKGFSRPIFQTAVYEKLLVENFSLREAEAARLHFGTDGDRPLSKKEVAKHFKISVSQIDRILRKVIRQIGTPDHIRLGKIPSTKEAEKLSDII